MYLEKLSIRNFRAISELNLQFNKGVNIIIGENNSGKTAIIDALRICLSVGKQIKEIGIRNDDDFHINTSDISDEVKPIEFDLFFKIEKDSERSIFASLLYQDPEDIEYQDVRLYFRYFLQENSKGNMTLRYSIKGGQNDSPKYEELQELYYTYLAPLRDAERELRPYTKENKLTSFFNKLTSYDVDGGDGTTIKYQLDKNHKEQLANKLQKAISEPEWLGLINTGESIVNKHLFEADIRRKEAKVNIQLLEYKYENIIKGILTRHPVYSTNVINGHEEKQRYFDVSQNGLGENNLIYAATTLSDLNNRKKEEVESYYALLIEEPEAHLHPQKQNTFFNYLNNLKDTDIQIFITSHFPTITAKSNLNNVIVLQKQNHLISSFSINDSELTPKDKKFLSKFLDVTKSQLFFSNGVILVEGISEALLLPILAKKIGEKYDLSKNGIEIVNLDGVAFNPFVNLFNSQDPNKRMACRCVAITDDDRFIEGDTDTMQISPRASSLEESKIEGANLEVELAIYTFEYELMTKSSENADIIKQIYESMHPRTNLKAGDILEDRAFELLDKLKSNKDKSELAQQLSIHLEENTDAFNRFVVPDYIERAIKWVVNL